MTQKQHNYKNRYLGVIILIVSLIPYFSFAQLTTNTSLTPSQLVQNILVGSGITISNVTYNGNPTSIGSFDGSNSNLGISSGIMLASGDISTAIGPNNTPGAGIGYNLNGDVDLNAISSNTTFDAAILEFDFIPSSDMVSFKYVFASEEYLEYVNSSVNDAFGFFISGPGITGPYSNNSKNIAIIPNTSLPVTIDNLNSTSNSTYYFDNGDGINSGGSSIQYDGFTKPLTAVSTVQCGQTYHIKIVIADAGDGFLDSGVFLEGGTFGTNQSSFSVNSPTICVGQSTVLTATGGVSYSWSTGANTSSINVNPTSSQNYTVNISTAGCGSVQLISNVVVVTTPTVVVNPATICSGTTATLTASGATTFSWAPSIGLNTTTGTSVLATPVTSIIYTVTGTTPCGVSAASSTVTVVPSPTVSVNSVKRCGLGNANLLAIGADTYLWAPITGLNTSTGASVAANIGTTTTYTVTGTIANGCSDTAVGTVEIQNFPIVSTSNSISVCEGDSVLLTANGADTYVWAPANDLNANTGNSVISKPNSNITYTITGTNTCGSANAISSIFIQPLPRGSLITNLISCEALESEFYASDSYPPYTFYYKLDSIDQPPLQVDGDSIEKLALKIYRPTTEYGIAKTITLVKITDAHNCTYNVNRTDTVMVYPNPLTTFLANPVKTNVIESEITLVNESIGASDYYWTFGDGTKYYGSNPQYHTYKDTGKFDIVLIAKSDFGCTDSSFQTIIITPLTALYIPNAFTPNGDRNNDVFKPYGEGILKFEMQIFDRWGNLLFVTDDLEKGWNGKVDGGEKHCQNDTYVYAIVYRSLEDRVDYILRGLFSLIR